MSRDQGSIDGDVADGGPVDALGAAANKRRMQDIFSELSKGNGKPLIDSLAEDFCWTLLGTTAWSRTYQGKQTVIDELFGPLFAQFATTYYNTAHRFIAEDDYVVIQCQGRVTTTGGKPYNNSYCFVCRLAEGKLVELTEYQDTELLSKALEAPEPKLRRRTSPR